LVLEDPGADTPKPNRSTRLAADRTRLSYERTLMAWLRTGVSLITLGFAIYKFGEELVEKNVAPASRHWLGSCNFALIVIGSVWRRFSSPRSITAGK
jgi:putative membrane protein